MYRIVLKPIVNRDDIYIFFDFIKLCKCRLKLTLWVIHVSLPILNLTFFSSAVIYFLLFGFHSSPFLELNNGDPPLHCCSHDAVQIRTEVEALRQDFNVRMKKIIFNSVVGAYYSSFIPCCFAQVSQKFILYLYTNILSFVFWVNLNLQI